MAERKRQRFESAGRGIIAVSQPVRELRPVAVAPTLEDDADFNTVRTGLITVASFRVEDIHFEFGSSFLLPFDFDAGPLKRLIDRHEGSKLAVFGHADPVGQEEFNKILSGRRAAAMYGLLVRDVDLWQKLYFDHDSNGKDGWGVGPVQIMLKRIGQDPGRTDAQLDDPTRAALLAFQKKQGLSPTGFDQRNEIDSATFKKLARLYMDTICVDRSSVRFKPPILRDSGAPGLDATPFQLQKSDFIAQGNGRDLKGDVQGCSEFNALMRFSQPEEARLSRTENQAERNRENQPNRRVMILLFHGNIQVDPAQWPCPTFKQGVTDCKRRFFSDHARRTENAEDRRTFFITKDTFACRFFQRLNEHSDFQIVSNERLISRFALTQFEGVAKFMTRNEFHSWMLVLFGADIPEQTLDQVRQQLLEKNFPNCEIELVAKGFEGHVAAYDRTEKIILIDQGLARRAEKDNDAAAELASSLVEEFGHFVDDHMRTKLSNIGGDADLDEGAAFGFAVVNLKHDIQSEIEFGQYSHDGATTTLRLDYAEMRRATQSFFSEQERIDDARTERFEFFGAGPGVRRSGQQPGASFGHESIEFNIAPVGFVKDEKIPAKSELKRVYFGNWLRDYSQAIDPKLVRPPGSSSSNDGFLRDSLTDVLDIIAREHFENDPVFQVTKTRCGVYRPEEHIDNPKGLTDARSIDPEFRHAFAAIEGEIDPQFGLKKYIRTPGLPRGSGHSTAAEFIVAELDAALVVGRTSEGFRRLGAALHTIEDYFAHSNFVELSLIELGHPNVFPWAGTRISSADNPVLNGKFPVVTGMFGGSDTMVSVVDIAGEHLQNERPCQAGERGVGAKIALILLKDKGESELSRRLEFCLKKFEDLQRRFPKIAMLTCRMAEALFRWIKALLGSLMVRAMDGVAAAQILYVNDPTSNDPTHSMLAKDHDDHPLHVMAAKLAQIAARDIAEVMNKSWLGQPTTETPPSAALKYLVHPALLHERSRGGGHPLKGGLRLMWEEMIGEASAGGNAGKIKRVEGRKWLLEQFEKAKKEQEEIRKRAIEVDPKKAKEEVEELFRRLKELETPVPLA